MVDNCNELRRLFILIFFFHLKKKSVFQKPITHLLTCIITKCIFMDILHDKIDNKNIKYVLFQEKYLI